MLRFLLIILMIFTCGCAANTIYVNTDEVAGLGVEVSFPEGKVVPIKVRRVISGNQIQLTNDEIVTYIGVYIPKLYKIPEEAKDFNEKLVTENEIRLEFDNRQRDSKNRLLAYVYTVNGLFINAEIIREGLAKALNRPPNLQHNETLLQAEDEARKASRGIWSEDFKS